MRSTSFFVLVPVVLLACSSSDEPAQTQALSNDAGAESCSAKAAPATEKVQAAIDANVACGTDADCTTVEFHASCFDACTRAVATSGKAAVEAASSSASANECAPFLAAGCTLEAPPCEPPRAATCTLGKCT